MELSSTANTNISGTTDAVEVLSNLHTERGESWTATARRDRFELSDAHDRTYSVSVSTLPYAELSIRVGGVMGTVLEPLPHPLPVMKVNERLWLFSVLATATLSFDGSEVFQEMLRECGILGGAHLVMEADEMAEILRMDVKGMYAAAKKRELPGVKRIGRLLRFSRKAFFEWLNRVESPKKEKQVGRLHS